MTTTTKSTKPGAAVAVTSTALGVDMVLYSSLVPVLPVLPAVHGSPVLSGVLFAAYAVALLAATPLVGLWVDRSGPRVPMLAGLIGLAVATALFAAVVDVGGTAGFLALLAARAAQGVAASVSWTAGLALIAATHEPERRGRTMGVALSSVGIGVLIGPAVSGPLVAAFGLRAPFLLIAALAAADAVARILLIHDVEVTPTRTPYRALSSGPRFLLLVSLTLLGAAAIAFPEPVLPLHLSGLGAGTTAVGLVFAGSALAGSLAAPLAGAFADRFGPTTIAGTGALVTAAGFALIGRPSLAMSIAGLCVVGFGAQMILAPTLVLIGGLAEHVQPPAYGGAYALYNLAYTGGLAAAPLVAGGGAAVGGVGGATLGVGALAAVVAVVLLLRRTPPPQHAAQSAADSQSANNSATSPSRTSPGDSTEA